LKRKPKKIVSPLYDPEIPWSTDLADELYQISRWGDGYFGVNSNGDLCVLPNRTSEGPSINIAEVIEEMKLEKVSFPVVIRFHDILRSQVIKLNKTFLKTIEEANYKASYFGVYPVKVNQMREVVEEIVSAGQDFNYGLEAGSKAELLAALAMNTNPNGLTILNGYKDEEYLKLALLGRELGRKTIVVIEKYSELTQLIKISEDTGVEPIIGIRAKLTTRGSGKWANSGGDYAKFGLTIPEILKTVKHLKEIGKIHWLKLFHFHVGSQITDIRTIKECMTEGARIYAKLMKMGAPLEFFDVGGGVGVNYDGSKSNQPSSINYSLEDYVGDVVYILKDICDAENVAHPNIVSESGRLVTAHHSCVVFDVFGKIEIAKDESNLGPLNLEHSIVKFMAELLNDIKAENYQDIYNDATLKKEEAQNAFKLGILSLEERSKIEGLFWSISKKVIDFARFDKFAPPELIKLKDNLADQYLCNLSIFQSAADSWAIGQVLPVVPIKRLNERPTTLAKLADITCDSDGKIDCFLGPDGQHMNSVPLHELKDGEDYYLGLFMTGAYQDIMGDMHNLFGKLNEVHVFCDDDDPTDFYIEEIIWGNKKSHVLSSMQYSPWQMSQMIKAVIDQQIREGKIKPRMGVKLVDFYEECINGYTYLKK
jgi:arginine decarboxylase